MNTCDCMYIAQFVILNLIQDLIGVKIPNQIRNDDNEIPNQPGMILSSVGTSMILDFN